MKNILILNYEYPPLGWGAWVVSKEYAEGLVKLWNNVTVITTWFEWESEISENWNLKIIRLKSLRKKIFQSNPIEMLSWAFKSIRFLNIYLKEYNFDVCIGFFSIPGWIVAKYINKKFKIPYIISTHWHDIPWFFPEQMRKFHVLTNWYTKKIWEKAEKILVLTTQMKKLADNFWNPEKNIILPNGCYSDFFYPDISKKKDIFTILFVWRLVEQKDPFTMLKAIKILKSKTSNFIVNIAWDWPLRQDIEKFIKENNLAENIKFTWWLTKEQIREYYQSSHIQICSSKIEAMSVAILESLYSGLYIISTPISGNTDMIQEWITWEFFEIWDSEKLWNKLIYWSENYKNLNYYDKIIEEIKEKYNRDNIIYKLNEIINDA